MDVLKFGLIGVGRFGKHYVRLLQELPGVELVAITNTSDNEYIKELKKLHPALITTNNPTEVLQNKSINCVVIATPTSTHAELVKEALKNGKHVLVEKPMVLSIEEADSIKEILPDNLTLMVGYQYIYNDYIQYIKNNLLENIGEVKYILAEKLYCGPIRYDVGCFTDAGSHDLAIINYLFNPGEVMEANGKSIFLNSDKRDDFTAVTTGFESGLKTYMVTSWFMPEKTSKVTIVGEKGMIVFNDVAEKDKLIFYPRPYPFQNLGISSYQMTEELKIPSQVQVVDAHEPLQSELEYFIECVRTNSKPITNFDFAYQITKMNDVVMEKLKE